MTKVLPEAGSVEAQARQYTRFANREFDQVMKKVPNGPQTIMTMRQREKSRLNQSSCQSTTKQTSAAVASTSHPRSMLSHNGHISNNNRNTHATLSTPRVRGGPVVVTHNADLDHRQMHQKVCYGDEGENYNDSNDQELIGQSQYIDFRESSY